MTDPQLYSFWKTTLEGFTAPTVIAPSQAAHEQLRSISYHQQVTHLDPALRDQINASGLAMTTWLQASWALLLSRYSGESDVVFGVQSQFPEGGCDRPLPLRLQVLPDVDLASWLTQLQKQVLIIQNDYPASLAQIQSWSQIPTDKPLFESLVIVSEVEDKAVESTHQNLSNPEEQNFPLIILGSTKPDFKLRIRYDRRRFDDDTITRLLGHLQTILAGMINAEAQQRLVDVPWLTTAEREQLLVTWNQTEVEYPHDQCIHQLFEAQVARSPDAIALIFPAFKQHCEQQLTYRELNQQANQLAHYLHTLGVGPDILVGICVERSLDMVVGLLGILKAGGAYVPIDPTYPQERQAYMLLDSHVSVLLTQQQLSHRLPETQASIVYLDAAANWQGSEEQFFENLHYPVQANHLAYVIYTSGSTGKPKGVMLSHQALCNHMCWMQTAFPLEPTDKVIQKTPFSFDASVWEFFAPLLSGSQLFIALPSGHQDVSYLIKTISERKITILQVVPSLLHMLLEMEEFSTCDSLRRVFCGGETLSTELQTRFHKKFKDVDLINLYGPTEACIDSTYWVCRRGNDQSIMPIGRPISNAQVYILDAYLQAVPVGVLGELYIGGDGLARGYLNRSELTQERFIHDPFSQKPEARLYKTGDLARHLPDGNIEFMGRADFQVKIRGLRIELREIESALSHYPGVRQSTVIVREDQPGDQRLVVYGVAADREVPTTSELRQFLQQTLPDYMIPSAFVRLDKLPLTPNGKIDRKALPKPIYQVSTNFVGPNTPIERTLAEIWSHVLGLNSVGIEDNFFDLGGTSILGLRLIAQIQQQLSPNLRAVKLYQYPTIRSLAQYLLQADKPTSTSIRLQPQRQNSNSASTGIAIIGMVGRFPGAQSVTELWQNLCDGVESTTWFTLDEIDPSVDPELRDDPNYVRTKGIIQGAETFDASFFGISPREAEIMDPQARVFLELAHEALETSGHTPDTTPGTIGLYAGSAQNTYFERHICGRPEIVDRLGAFQTMLANEKDFLVTRTSYKLNLTGPSVSINTACSTSLVAVAQAFQALLSHQCDLALAGGISITTPQNTGYLYQEGGMLSPDGRCRPFDVNAQGTMFNSGAGIVVLKRLEDAIADRDCVYAVIRGVGINNDGSGKVSFTAPSVDGQAAAIAMAQSTAGFSADTISYVETHGTATPLGDPIEIEALTQAFQSSPIAPQACAIGSIKSNIGHVVAAAGVAGLIKTALALHHQKIPASLNFTSPNPQLDLPQSPFYVNTTLSDWPAGNTPRRAGVSSFGVGGTNAHVVLEEAPPLPTSSPSRPCHLLLLSAKTGTALDQITSNLKTYLQQHPTVNLADVAFTLQQGRQAFNYRRFVVCRDVETAIANLTTPDPKLSGDRQTEIRDPDVVFMFPGQGSQYVNMGLNLYQQEPRFRQVVDRCANILQPLLNQDIREIIYPAAGSSEAAATALRQTVYTQPALFTIEYALAQLWLSWGVQPAALIGHSIGEFVAACLAGVFSLEDGLKLVATRGRLMWELPPGSMLSVLLPAATLQPRLGEDLAIAAINGPSLCVVSGPTQSIDSLQAELEAEAVVCRTLHTSHAFHSPMMNPIIEPFLAVVKTIQLAIPRIPFVSTVTADWITDAQALDPLYWAGHLRATVRFAEGVKTLWQQPERVLLEVGPRTTATTLARQQAKDIKRQIAISSLTSTADDQAESSSLLAAIGQLWIAGVTLDWNYYYANEYRQRLPLPTYPFERQRYWIDPKPAIAESFSPSSEPTTMPEVQPQPLPEVQPLTQTRQQRLLPLLKEVLEATSGLEIASIDEVTTFLDLGLDSLSLTQIALAIQKKFKIKITFRNLLEDYPNLDTLVEFIDRTLPADALPAPDIQTPLPQNSPAPVAIMTTPNPAESNGIASKSTIEAVIAQQLQIMTQQIQLLGLAANPVGTANLIGTAPIAAVAPVANPVTPPPAAPPTTLPTASTLANSESANSELSQETKPKKSFGPGAKIEKSTTHVLTTAQQAALDRIISRYIKRTPESKRQTQEHRPYLADPRTVSGFTPLLKEIVYPIVVERSSGSKLWDVDGNEYIDLTNGFGMNFFGWSPEFVKDAVTAQLNQGIEIGPQTPLAGRVAKQFIELTGNERVAFCNTGSEAVMAAMRLARTVTGRSTIAMFNGAYHGTFDEVIVKGTPNLRSLPAAPGILPSMFENTLVLDYGTPEALQILRDRVDDLAAILVEPVQSRRPDLQPREFLQDLRKLTEKSETALIFDEVVTGFRAHLGGAQAYFDIRADLATYGKIVGGGLPIGIVAGKATYMDALDGGAWDYGDTSFPEVGVTFFAGTFVRHPLALAAADVVLQKLKAGGPELQWGLAQKVDRFVNHLNQHFERVQAPIKLNHFTSLFYVSYPPELPYAGLLFYLLREKGVHIWDHRPCFFTLAHSELDIELVTRSFKDSVAELQAAGFLPGISPDIMEPEHFHSKERLNANHAPQPGARLGRDPEGNPAWYVPDPDRPGKYLQLATIS